MRAKILLAVAMVAAAGLAGCGKDEKKMTQEPQASTAAAYDTSADSNKKYLAANKAKPGVITRPDGLQISRHQIGQRQDPDACR